MQGSQVFQGMIFDVAEIGHCFGVHPMSDVKHADDISENSDSDLAATYKWQCVSSLLR